MPQNLPITTLFMLESLDGKISTGDNDDRDVDKDFKTIDGVKEGLSQYYQLEQETDLFSLNSGRVMAKIGVNERTEEPKKIPVSFIIIDNLPHLTERGLIYLCKWVKTLYVATTNRHHPAFELQKRHDNIVIIPFEESIDLKALLSIMKTKYCAEKITLQSGGTLNAEWLRQGLIDFVSIVIAPCLIGGESTQSLIGGESLHSKEDVMKIKALNLMKCEVLEDSYIHVKYEVLTAGSHQVKV